MVKEVHGLKESMLHGIWHGIWLRGSSWQYIFGNNKTGKLKAYYYQNI